MTSLSVARWSTPVLGQPTQLVVGRASLYSFLTSALLVIDLGFLQAASHWLVLLPPSVQCDDQWSKHFLTLNSHHEVTALIFVHSMEWSRLFFLN